MTKSGAADIKEAAELTQLRGVGPVLAKRLKESGFDSFEKIAGAGEEELKKIGGLSPRAVGSIIEQARRLCETPGQGTEERREAVQRQLSGVREKLQGVAESARGRFQDQLGGRSGKKLAADLVRIEDALSRIREGGKKRAKRSAKALAKAEKRVTGLEDAGLKKIRRSLKRARKAVLKAL